MAAPLIAVPAYHLDPGRVRRWPWGAFGAPDLYFEALHRAGGRAAMLTTPDEADPTEILGRFDGLMLLGGGDVEPRRFGASPSPTLYGLEPERDELEIRLIRAADELGVPTLAICRGFQVVNVAFGGTLHQHIPDLEGLIPHGTPGGGEPVTHGVAVEPGSRLAEATGATTLACSSHHHQAVDRLGEGLVVAARTSDGLVEGLERPTGWLVAVQWHPEDTAADDPEQQALFDTFVRHATGRA